MPEMPVFHVCAPPRCCWRDENRPGAICGALATSMGSIAKLSPAPFWCNAHAPHGAVPITGELVVRRVSLQVEVVFTATSELDGPARSEALRQLEAAVETVGGVVSLSSATTALGRWTPPARAPYVRAGVGKG